MWTLNGDWIQWFNLSILAAGAVLLGFAFYQLIEHDLKERG